MKRRVKYTDEPMGELKRVKDFLPPPEQLVFKKEDKSAVTIELSNRNIEFFKKEAKKHQMEYKEMISLILEEYAYRNDKH